MIQVVICPGCELLAWGSTLKPHASTKQPPLLSLPVILYAEAQ